jgi:hypothetical protein
MAERVHLMHIVPKESVEDHFGAGRGFAVEGLSDEARVGLARVFLARLDTPRGMYVLVKEMPDAEDGSKRLGVMSQFLVTKETKVTG